MNQLLIFLKNEKNWILKTVNGKHLLNFSDFFNFLDRPNLLKNNFSLSCHGQIHPKFLTYEELNFSAIQHIKNALCLNWWHYFCPHNFSAAAFLHFLTANLWKACVVKWPSTAANDEFKCVSYTIFVLRGNTFNFNKLNFFSNYRAPSVLAWN